MPSMRLTDESVSSWEKWRTRYPRNFNGAREWEQQSVDGNRWIPPSLPDPLPLLARVSPGAVVSRPRVFVSHRQGDEKYAERIASLADTHGFEFWLDTINMPPPPVVATMTALSIALRIEMALLNCSHVIATYTSSAPGSAWIPYEYGRVKEPVLQSTRCCTWLYTTPPTPEWVELNAKREHEAPLVQWLGDEFRAWCAANPTCPTSAPVGSWRGATIALP